MKKNYEEFIGIPASLWAVACLILLFAGAITEISSSKQIKEQQNQIMELKERGDFYCDAYQSCMEALDKRKGK